MGGWRRVGGWLEAAGDGGGMLLEVAGVAVGLAVAVLVGFGIAYRYRILAIHLPLNTAYVSVSTEPPDYNHDYVDL